MKLFCKACGGGLNPEDERCSLCGTPAGVDPDELEYVELTGGIADNPSPVLMPGESEDFAETEGQDVFCNDCGWKNPAGANFCSRCGKPLQQVGAAPARVVTRPPVSRTEGSGSSVEQGVGLRVGIIVGSAVLMVLAAFLLYAMSADPPIASGPQPAVPLTADAFADVAPGIAQAAEALQDSVEASTGEERVGFLRRTVELYIGAGRYDLAGEYQRQVAAETDQELDWAFAGNLFYDSMERAVEQSDLRATLAKAAVAAYQEVLRLNPDNLDVRTDMAVAYLSDPDNPMAAIQETQEVLRRDSLHVQANFNRGIMLFQINRMEQARDQFLKVQRIVGNPEDALWQRAQSAIDQIEAAMSGQGT
ncbi:MAG: zinc-ribbon domain-containing protein [Rhodothermales bacterium]|nr:zinc-ribbon domain-containing protein [Rhodothermales bacterium]MBO6781251.1 zinc-ribbon domain-containing protein [Rhodothermales bacterium]